MAKVDVNKDNLERCRCPVCPVQQGSGCFKKKMEEVGTAGIEGKKMPKVEDLKSMALYCAVGPTACNDLDLNQSCLCPICRVWASHDLQSMYY